MKPQPLLERTGDVLCQEVAGELVLLDLDRERYFGLNDTGAAVWQLLAEPLTLPALLDRLEAEFEVGRAALERDVRALLGDLEKAGLIRIGT